MMQRKKLKGVIMSKENKFQLKSLAQLMSYSGVENFLKEYHKIVKEEYGQYLGINKALICLSKMFSKYENHHEMSSKLKEQESEGALLTVRKQLISISVIYKDGSIIEGTNVFNYTDWDKARFKVFSVLEDVVGSQSYDIDELLEFFDSVQHLFTESELNEFIDNGDVDEFLEAVKASGITIYEIVEAIDNMTENTDIRIEEEYIDIDVTTSDLEYSLISMN